MPVRTTHMARSDQASGRWYVVDAGSDSLGRVAARIAHVLRGKHRPDFTPHVNHGDHIIVLNAANIVLTGNKLDQKRAYRHSGYPGGLKAVPYRQLLARTPERAIEKAVKGMLPKNRLGRQLYKNLKVYRGSDHPHQAQQPQPFATAFQDEEIV